MEPMQDISEVEWENVTTLPKSKWSEKKYWLDEVAEKMELPEVVRVCSDLKGTDFSKKIDPSIPFLVYSRRRRTKVFSELLWWDDQKKAWVVDGPIIEVPKDYTGWFEIVKSSNDKITGFPNPCSTIKQIADDGCNKFLVRSSLMGHVFEEDSNVIALKQEVEIFPGEILVCKGIGKRKWKIKEKVGSLKKEPETLFLKCSDHRNNDICVSLGHPGQFSPIFDEEREDSNPKNAVYQVIDILDERMPFPVHVKLAFGCMPTLPVIPRKWQGIMSLVGSIRPDSLVVCSLVPNKIPLLEIPVDTNVQVQVAQQRSKWADDPKFKRVINQCYKKVYPFLTSLKFLDVKYQKRDLNSKEGDPQSSKKQTGRTTSPLEMTTFNPLDVYPPLQKADVSESWTLSFKDPEHMLDVEGINLNSTVSSTSTDASDVALIRTHNRMHNKSRQTITNGSDSIYKNFPQKPAVGSDLRAANERDMSRREANC